MGTLENSEDSDEVLSIELFQQGLHYTIRICQPENSKDHFRGLTNPDVNRKRMHLFS